jgi:hypothetical protein
VRPCLRTLKSLFAVEIRHFSAGSPRRFSSRSMLNVSHPADVVCVRVCVCVCVCVCVHRSKRPSTLSSPVPGVVPELFANRG